MWYPNDDQKKSAQGDGPASPHPSFTKVYPYICMCRDAYEGTEERVRDFIPGDEAESWSEWAALVKRTTYWGAFQRTVAGIVGLTFTDEPVLTGSERIVEWAKKDVSGYMEPLDDLAIQIATEVYITGRVGIWVDFNEAKGAPKLCVIRAEDIPNWAMDDRGLKRVNMTYDAIVPKGDWEYQTRKRVKVLTRETGVVETIIYEKDEKKQKWNEIERYTPVVATEPLPELPFTLIDITDGKGWRPGLPPLRALASMSFGIYATAAQIEKIAYHAGSPTPYIKRSNPNQDSHISIGATSVAELEQGDELGYMEASGGSIESLIKLQDVKTQQLVSLGARLLDVGSAGESGIALKVRSAAERGILSQTASALDRGITHALSFAAKFWKQPAPSWKTVKNFTGIVEDMLKQSNKEDKMIDLAADPEENDAVQTR